MLGIEPTSSSNSTTPVDFRASRRALEKAHRPADDIDDLHARIQRRVGILKNHLNIPCAVSRTLVQADSEYLPFKKNLAAGGRDKRVISRAVVDFPQPLSPTRPKL